MYKRLFPSTEAIKDQGDRFFKRLTEVITKLKEDHGNPYRWGRTELGMIEAVIKEETNAPVRVSLNDFGPSILVPSLADTSPLFRDSDFTGQTLLKYSNKGVLSGSIDLNTGKLKGDFTKIHADVLLNPELLFNSNVTAEEHAASILHELGHLFTYYEFLTRSTRTNWAIKEIVNNVTGIDDPAERKTILVSTLSDVATNKLDIEKLSQLSKPEQIVALVIADQKSKSISEIGTDIYDMVNWEFLSDQYVVKHGGGRALLSLYDKILNREKQRSKHLHFTIEALKASGLIITLPLSFWLLPMAMLLDHFNFAKKLYDRPETRLTRIRNQMIQSLKDYKLDDNIRKRIRSDIEYIDTIIKPGRDRLTFVGMILNKVIPFRKERYDQEKMQYELERLAMNDLFVKAYDLKQLN